MTRIMPLRRVVVEITHEAPPEDAARIRRCVRSWHNRLSNGTVPRSVITKLGRELYLNLDAWEKWLEEQADQSVKCGPGRPRAK
jgi:hypothetical protein